MVHIVGNQHIYMYSLISFPQDDIITLTSTLIKALAHVLPDTSTTESWPTRGAAVGDPKDHFIIRILHPLPLILNPPNPLIIRPPLCYILVLYWGVLLLGGWGGFSIRGRGLHPSQNKGIREGLGDPYAYVVFWAFT